MKFMAQSIVIIYYQWEKKKKKNVDPGFPRSKFQGLSPPSSEIYHLTSNYSSPCWPLFAAYHVWALHVPWHPVHHIFSCSACPDELGCLPIVTWVLDESRFESRLFELQILWFLLPSLPYAHQLSNLRLARVPQKEVKGQRGRLLFFDLSKAPGNFPKTERKIPQCFGASVHSAD